MMTGSLPLREAKHSTDRGTPICTGHPDGSFNRHNGAEANQQAIRLFNQHYANKASQMHQNILMKMTPGLGGCK